MTLTPLEQAHANPEIAAIRSRALAAASAITIHQMMLQRVLAHPMPMLPRDVNTVVESARDAARLLDLHAQAEERADQAERRATQSEQRIAQQPHGPNCKPWRAEHWPDDPDICRCWKTAPPATDQKAAS